MKNLVNAAKALTSDMASTVAFLLVIAIRLLSRFSQP